MDVDMRGRVVVITGGFGSIGGAAAASLCRRGAHVVVGCRDVQSAREAASALVDEAGGGGGKITCLHLDTSLVSSARSFAEEFKVGPPAAFPMLWQVCETPLPPPCPRSLAPFPHWLAA